MFQQGIKAIPFDQLHHVIVDPPVLSDAEHRDNIGVMEATGRFGFPQESFNLFLSTSHSFGGKYFECNAPSQGLLPRLVNNSHSTPADFTSDTEVAQLLWHRCRGFYDRRLPVWRFIFLLFQLFHHGNGGEQCLDFIRVIWITVNILVNGRTFSTSNSFDKFFGQHFDGVLFRMRVSHDCL